MCSLVVIIIGILVPVVQGQVSDCGTKCIQNLLAEGPALGCSSTDAGCVCKNANFGYGLRDCAFQACGAAQESAVVAYAQAYCSSALAAAGSSANTIVTSATGTVTVSSITTGAIVTPISASMAVTATVTNPTGTVTVTSTTPTPSATNSSTVSNKVSSSTASASSTFSSSTTTPTEVASTDGLTSGAKAGIGVGVVLGVIFALLIAFFCFRRRKKQSTEKEMRDPEIAESPAGHEMITSANTHEMDAKRGADFQVGHVKLDRPEGFQELETQSSAPIHSVVKSGYPAEMDAPYNNQSTNVGSGWEHFQPSELDGNASAAQRAELQSSSPMNVESRSAHSPAAPPILGTSRTEALGSTEQGSASAPAASSPPSSSSSGALGKPDEKLQVLRERMERVREDKARLEKIQALKDLEAELQSEILAEQRKAAGM